VVFFNVQAKEMLCREIPATLRTSIGVFLQIVDFIVVEGSEFKLTPMRRKITVHDHAWWRRCLRICVWQFSRRSSFVGVICGSRNGNAGISRTVSFRHFVVVNRLDEKVADGLVSGNGKLYVEIYVTVEKHAYFTQSDIQTPLR
jgi:hypothetical protein